MKEEKILSIIKSVIGDKYIGDDCAYIKDLGIIVSQDSLVEDVHFSLKYISPYQLGYKSAMVNISDISASGGEGKYITVALSLPKNITDNFVKEFYEGLSNALKKCGNIEVIGGDITGSDKIMVSITIIGIDKNRKISSRSHAQTGQVIVASGVHGSSAIGLKMLLSNKNFDDKYKHLFIPAHLMPEAQVQFSKNISKNIQENYAMMDSSDGLADTLYKIATASNKTLVVDFNKIEYEKELEELFPENYVDMILFGGEDYQIIATIPEELANKFGMNIIGRVVDKIQNEPVKILNVSGGIKIIKDLEKCFNHFE